MRENMTVAIQKRSIVSPMSPVLVRLCGREEKLVNPRNVEKKAVERPALTWRRKMGKRANHSTARDMKLKTRRLVLSREARRTDAKMAALVEREAGNLDERGPAKRSHLNV